jgi:catechol 2,3-dioxygenase-like lactoylglutathione lyase family enzyme
VKVRQLGHVVLKVRERGRSERFYTEVLGLRIAAGRARPGSVSASARGTVWHARPAATRGQRYRVLDARARGPPPLQRLRP